MSRHAVHSGSSSPVPSSRLPGYVAGTGLGGDDGRAAREVDLRGMFAFVVDKWVDGWKVEGEGMVGLAKRGREATTATTEANSGAQRSIQPGAPLAQLCLHYLHAMRSAFTWAWYASLRNLR